MRLLRIDQARCQRYARNAQECSQRQACLLSRSTGQLHSQGNSSTKVKRIVITSSAAAVAHKDPNPVTFTEADWNDQCLEILKKYENEGRRNEAPGDVKYDASKTLAERCA